MSFKMAQSLKRLLLTGAPGSLRRAWGTQVRSQGTLAPSGYPRVLWRAPVGKRSLEEISSSREKENIITEAEAILAVFRKGRPKPSDEDCLKVIKSYLYRDMAQHAWRFLLKDMREAQLQPTVEQFNTLINGYCELKRLDKVKHLVFRCMAQKKVKADAQTCSLTIRTYRSRGQAMEAYNFLVNRMERELGVKPELSHFIQVIKGLCHQRNYPKVMEILKHDIPAAGLKLDNRPLAAVVDALSQTGRLEEAERFLKEEVPSFGVSLTARDHTPLIRAYLTRGEPQKAEKLLFESLPSQGHRVPVDAVVELLKGYIAKKHFSEAERLVLHTLKGREVHGPPIKCFNALLQLYRDGKRVTDMEHLIFEHLPSVGLAPDRQSLSLLIQAYVLVDRVEEAEKILLDELRDRLQQADHVAFALVLEGYARRGNYGKVSRLLNHDMKIAGLEPDPAGLTSLLKAYVFAKDMDRAEKLITQTFPKAKIRPSLRQFNLLIHGYMQENRYEDAEDVFSKIIPKFGFQPSWHSVEELLLGYLRSGDVRRARAFVNSTLRTPGLKIKAQYITQAEQILERLKQKGIVTRKEILGEQ